MKNLQVGDKVEIPLIKSIGCDWEKCFSIKRAIAHNRNYLFICNINFNRVELSYTEHRTVGEKFDISDLKPYNLSSPNIETILELKKTIREINGKEEENNRS